MEIPSSSSTSCFHSALDYLGWLYEAPRHYYSPHNNISDLKGEVRLLQTFDLYLTKCRRRRRNRETCLEQNEEEKDVTSFRIQQLIIRKMVDLESARIEDKRYLGPERLIWVASELTIFRKAIKLFFETDIKESWIDFLLDYYWLRDPGPVIDFIDSVSENLEDLLSGRHKFRKALIVLVKALKEKLMFLKCFIGFSMLHGVEGQQLIDLLIHAEVVAFNALRLIYKCWFHGDDEKLCEEMELQISRLIREKIYPSSPQVRQTYFHVLTASKLSSSSNTSTLEKNKHLVADFMDCLVHIITELVQSCTSILVPIMKRMLKLLEGLRFLTILLRHQQKFKELRHEMKTLIAVVVRDAAIVIFSLSVNQLIKEGLANETDLALLHLLKVLKLIRAEVTQVYPLTSVSGFGFPRINELGSMDFFLKNLKKLASCDEINGSIAFPVDKIQKIQKDFEFLRSFLEKIKEQCNQSKKIQAFWSRVMEAAYKAELVIDWTLVGDERECCLDDVATDINLMKTEAQEIYGSISYDGETKRVTETFTCVSSQVIAATKNEEFVCLDDEVKTITDRLTGGSRKLGVVPIVGMPGLGKTTLANMVYSSPSVKLHFHIRAWCTVSQIYSTHNLLVQILHSIDSRSPEQYPEENEGDLALKLKQALLRNRYLLVLDDLWGVEAWNLLEKSLPDDANGSRILITSRLQNLFLQLKLDSKVHHLRPLTDEESWKLLQNKLFGKEGCPAKLSGVGFQLAKSCRGLPLTVVLVAGILATTGQNCWQEVAKSLSSSIVLDDEYCMKTLELSYSHLPGDLKPCLLYFSAFRADKNVPIRRLLWLWISEGFVQKTEEKSLEDVADEYLKDLVDRSLVMVSEHRTRGGAKACRLHDLVHEFCVEKAKEENFLHIIHSQNDPIILTIPSNRHRVCDQNARNLMTWDLMLLFPNLRSLLLFKEDAFSLWLPQLLRVLDLRNLKFDAHFPMVVVLLVHLRYLALYITGINSIPPEISNLSRLQTFLVRGYSRYFLLPKTIWNIKTLRHLYYTTNGGFAFPVENLEVSPCLDHLDTLNLAIDPSSQSLQKILTKLPSIRRLKCSITGVRIGNGGGILEFDCLSQLESLNLSYFTGYGFKFPRNLKKLTVSDNKQPWSEISTIGKLPNLQVLKLKHEAFAGEEWVKEEGEFPSLRVLKLARLDFRRWTAASDNFPRLEQLVLYNCRELEEVPSCLGECPTLEAIEVGRCGESVVSSVEKIQQEQMDMGNEDLKIVIEQCGDAWIG
ncbi:putative late blight resistance protein homolog R1A-3 [Coffea arabica]|uniref:Late blight resistance protein homolog R1A-3 n=1 Tax=Coffea arabica TaxID=13443 RepID=A0A6P6TD44_COFAR|nr:putative late blight resistance protein homolog R1A-3 [Coffea arabica]